MDSVFEIVAACRHAASLFAGLPAGLPALLFVAGLVGSAGHCIGMCGPFVLGQVMADSAVTGRHYGEWQRLSGALLLTYHFGRLTTYAALGAAAGMSTALLASTAAFAYLSAGLLTVGACLMLVQALGFARWIPARMGTVIGRWAVPLASARGPWSRYALGLVLGLLPCGLVYGALAMAAGTGSTADGAVAMAAFGLGTVPALAAVGWGGSLLRRRLQGAARWAAVPLLFVNAALAFALAGGRL